MLKVKERWTKHLFFVTINMVIYMLYSSISNEKIKNIKKLNEKKYRDNEGLFLVEGEHLVLEAYKNNCLKILIVEEGYSFDLNIDKMIVTGNVLKYISKLDSYPKVMGICYKKAEKEIGNNVLIIDGVQDPGNLGTIIRSAVAFNIDTIILGEDSVDLYNSKVIRSTQGMLFNINIIEKNLFEMLPKLRELNYKLMVTNLNGGKDIKTIEKNDKFAIIVGNEGQGVKKEIIDLCDESIYIDMNSNCESLNVAVATGIILYELDKKV